MLRTEDLLKEHGLRLTDSRLKILDVFLTSGHALSHADIEKKMNESLDRVTVYRTLTSFLDKGLVHKVIDDSEASKYALCHNDCSSHEHHDNHVHFKCNSCGTSNCLNEISIPKINLPKGYQLAEANLLIEGICPNCK